MPLFLFRKRTVTEYRTDFRDFYEVSCARLKTCVVFRFVLDSILFGAPTQSEFPDPASHGLFRFFVAPQKKELTSTE
jgi:hypothetical protein